MLKTKGLRKWQSASGRNGEAVPTGWSLFQIVVDCDPTKSG
jgi:hypothetical protein